MFCDLQSLDSFQTLLGLLPFEDGRLVVLLLPSPFLSSCETLFVPSVVKFGYGNIFNLPTNSPYFFIAPVLFAGQRQNCCHVDFNLGFMLQFFHFTLISGIVWSPTSPFADQWLKTSLFHDLHIVCFTFYVPHVLIVRCYSPVCILCFAFFLAQTVLCSALRVVIVPCRCH